MGTTQGPPPASSVRLKLTIRAAAFWTPEVELAPRRRSRRSRRSSSVTDRFEADAFAGSSATPAAPHRERAAPSGRHGWTPYSRASPLSPYNWIDFNRLSGVWCFPVVDVRRQVDLVGGYEELRNSCPFCATVSVHRWLGSSFSNSTSSGSSRSHRALFGVLAPGTCSGSRSWVTDAEHLVPVSSVATGQVSFG